MSKSASETRHFVDFYESLARENPSIVQVFKREYSYSLHGSIALLLAHRLYKTTNVTRKDFGLETLYLNKKLFSRAASYLLEDNRSIQIWVKEGSDWVKRGSASPGDTRDIQNDIYTSEVGDSINQATCASLWITKQHVTVATLSKVFGECIIYDFDDSEDFWKLETLLNQHSVREVYVSTGSVDKSGNSLQTAKGGVGSGKDDIHHLQSSEANEHEQPTKRRRSSKSDGTSGALFLLREANVVVRYQPQEVFDEYTNMSTVFLNKLKPYMTIGLNESIMQQLSNGARLIGALNAILNACNIWNDSMMQRSLQITMGNTSLCMKYDTNVASALSLYPSSSTSDLSPPLPRNEWNTLNEINQEGMGDDDGDADSVGSSEATKNTSSQSSIPYRSVFQLLNHTKTPMGSRMLKQWLSRPLVNRAVIESRLDMVTALVVSPQLRIALGDSREYLRGFPDLEKTGKRGPNVENLRFRKASIEIL